jgi:stage II sporulation protein D
VCNVYSTTADQVFAGYAKESGAGGAQWVAAVTATEPTSTTGIAVTYHGAIVTAYYFSSSGGRTQNSEDVWVAALPWARSVDDHWSLDPSINPTYSHWSQTRTQAQVAAAFGLPDVASYSVTAWTAGNGARTVVARSSAGATAAVSGETLRSRLSLPSTWLTKPAAPPPPPPPPPPPTPGVRSTPVVGPGASSAVPPARRTPPSALPTPS